VTDVVRTIVDAVRDLTPGQDAPTRLATVTAKTTAGYTVHFDGEGAASPRVYKAVGSALVGERVLMVAAGRSWVVGGAVGEDSWTDLPLVNGWVHYTPGGYSTPQYLKRNGVVYLKGLIRFGTVSATMFTLPSGYRPSGIEHYVVANNGAAVVVQLLPDGRMIAPANNAWVALDGITFPAEQ